MSTQLSKKSVARNYAFLAVMLGAMILGSIVGWIFPQELDAEGNVISAGATVLIVAQRISTILHAEQIIVLDEGKIVGKGTHEELLQSCEVYQQIALSQLSKEELGK